MEKRLVGTFKPKQTMQTLTGILKRVAIGVLVGLMPASCSIMDYEGDCSVNYRARFRYDMHLHYSDAFAHEVESVTLYAFDESGKFVQQFTDSGEALQQEGYALPFELPAGTYQFVAWCGVENELQSHDVPTLTPGVSTLEELTCSINREYDENRQATVEEIAPVFHAFVPDCTLPDEPGTHDIDIPLTKDTKTVRIVLQHLSGEPIDVNQFSFQITDENGLMAHDNTLLDDELLHYQPYYTTSGTADMNSDGSRATTAISTALAELTVGRLVKDKDTRTILTVHNDKGETVLSIPLIDYALLVKGYYNQDLSDQEYLDRQDEYNLTFFLDENNHWISSSIIINSWRVVLSETEL